MKAIKLVVLAMGILIVVGIGLVVYGVIRNSNKTEAVAPPNVSVPGPGQVMSAPSSVVPSAAPSAETSAAPGQIPMSHKQFAHAPIPLDLPDLNLKQPAGSRIIATSSGRGRLFITIEGGGIDSRVVIIDLSTNQVSGTVRLGGAP